MNGVGEGLGETLVLSVQLLLLVLVPSSAVSDPRFVFDLLDDSLLCLPLLRWNLEPTTKKRCQGALNSCSTVPCFGG